MKFITGIDRNQAVLFPVTLDETVDRDNEVRLIDMFVDSLSLQHFGFKTEFSENGRPAYHPSDLLKLYIYGYLNKTRSSRDLEKETKRNIEVIWLLKGLKPDHNTIANFRRDNPKAIKKVFRATVEMAKHFDLIGGKLIAGDSTKLRAQNSKKNNFNQKKINRHIAYIEQKLEEFNRQLSEADEDNKKRIEQQIEKQKERKAKYDDIEKHLNESGESQLSTSDPESRHLITRNNITEVAYNVQTTVDAKNNIPIDYKVTNTNDSNALGNMLRRAKSILQNNDFTALYDKGYHTGSELSIADNLGIDVMVAVPTVATQAPDAAYNVERFKYSLTFDAYLCPQKKLLSTNGKWHKSRTFRFKRYTTKACKSCPVKELCSKAEYGKAIQRSEYQDIIDKNNKRIEQNRDYYRRRQAIAEHPYGTIKRQWGFGYILTKKFIKRAEADVGFMFTAYNLRRIFNIIGRETLKAYLKNAVFLVFALMRLLWQKISRLEGRKFLRIFSPPIFYFPQKGLFLVVNRNYYEFNRN